MDEARKKDYEAYLEHFCSTYGCTREKAEQDAIVNGVREMYEEDSMEDGDE